ncbi:histidine phosphatase family protein [Aliiruegeria lutimaris]|uniref:Broad specificity phosphatase PhoE n=1 Tax=Aliiruegeria lutimaris TaxID=571298 RepID=A0A1G9FFI4_9RHOB|nr:histidine phosphatase family protein [Aliiruegeria lutimaris]SDK87120.1 Broad specificity phosphatase PhoE [Aliiruegeria lutimaris]
MSRLIFITHPEVVVDPQLDIRQWGLSEIGFARMKAFADSPDVAGVTSIWSSAETKAIEAAEVLAARHLTRIQIDEDLGENDRSATGFLPPDEFERVAEAFFAEPDRRVRGWERAGDAQRRVAQAVARIVREHGAGDVAVVSHGAVGSLLFCQYQNRPISRAADQPFQGHYWQATLAGMAVVHSWKPIAPRL